MEVGQLSSGRQMGSQPRSSRAAQQSTAVGFPKYNCIWQRSQEPSACAVTGLLCPSLTMASCSYMTLRGSAIAGVRLADDNDIEPQPYRSSTTSPPAANTASHSRPKSRRLTTPVARIRRSPFPATGDPGASSRNSTGREAPGIVNVPRMVGVSPRPTGGETAVIAIVGCCSASRSPRRTVSTSRLRSPVSMLATSTVPSIDASPLGSLRTTPVISRK